MGLGLLVVAFLPAGALGPVLDDAMEAVPGLRYFRYADDLLAALPGVLADQPGHGEGGPRVPPRLPPRGRGCRRDDRPHLPRRASGS